jgi:outer membrane protein TolC
VLLALLPAAALPEDRGAPAPADLGALLAEAEANSPLLRAAAARLEAARRVPSQRQAPPDPMATIGYTNEGTSRFTLGESEDARLSLSWTQEVPYPGKLGKAADVATLEAEIAARELELVRLQVGAKIKSAYADLYRLDRTAAILSETRSVLDAFAQTAQRRYEAGEGIQESILKAQTEILRLEAELTRVHQERRAAELRISAVTGRPGDTPVGPATNLPAIDFPDDPGTLADAAVAVSPEIAALETAVRRSEASLQRARLDLKPDFFWSASYDNRGGLDPMLTGMFGLRLPLYKERKQAQAVLQAESELLAVRQDLMDRQVRIRAEVRDLVSLYQRAERLRALFGQGVVPQARMTLDSALASYGVGRIAFLDLLFDLTALLNARIEHVTQEGERLRVASALEPLLGGALVRLPDGEGRRVGDDAPES